MAVPFAPLLPQAAATRCGRSLVATVLWLAVVAAAAAQESADPGTADQQQLLAPAPSPHPELARGRASWYGAKFHGRPTSSGERFDMHELTAAHKNLPFGTHVRVRNEANGREVVVRINDRGPRVRGRVIDLSKAAAAALGFVRAGEARVVLLPH